MSNTQQGGLIASLLRFLTGKPAEPAAAPAAVATPAPAPAPVRAHITVDRAAWLSALGGAANVKSVAAVAGTRLRIELADAASVDAVALKALGAGGVMTVASNVVHVIAGVDAAAYAAQLG